MSNNVASRSLFALFLSLLGVSAMDGAGPARTVAPGFSGLPLDFVENRGQWNTNARFVAASGGLTAWLESGAIALSAGGGGVRLVFEGAAADVDVAGEERRRGVYNFFIGSDANRWRSDVPAYAAVRYKRMYTGIDIRVREGADRVLEYDVLVAPHSDLSRVVIRADGARSLDVESDGTLVIETAAGTLRQRTPVTWEELPSGQRRPIQSRFRLIDEARYGFETTERDAALPLVIDPGLEWSTFLGGSGPEFIGPAALATDGTGDVFVGGVMRSEDFPLFSDPTFVTGWQDRAFVARLSGTGSELRYATFFGGWHSQIVYRGLAVDRAGNAVLVGKTYSPDFPITAGAFDQVGLHRDGFVVRLTATGNLIFSTFIGGFWEDEAVAVAYDAAGNIIVGGTTSSDDFPTTVNAFDRSYNVPNAAADGGAHGDMFIARLTPDGSALTYGTYLGGPQLDVLEDLVVDSADNVTLVGWVTGNNVQVFVTTANAFDRTWNGSQDAAIARLRLDGSGAADLKYATLFGGSSQDNLWIAAIDPRNPELVTFAGRTWSNNYPVTAGVVRPTNPPFSDLFPDVEAGIITRFRFPAAGGGSLVWSTHHHADRITGLTVNEAGEPIVAGPSAPFDLQTTRGAFEVVADGAGAPGGGFISRLDAAASQYVYQSFFGGSGGIADNNQTVPQVAHVAGNTVIISGQTSSNDFHITPLAADSVSSNADGLSSEGFVTKITLEADASGDLTAAAPTLVSPPDGMTFHNGLLGRLEWNGVTDESGVEAYEFQVASRADFAKSFIGHRGGVATTEVLIPPSVGNSGGLSQVTWFWRVRTSDRAGNLSPWSSVRSFTISGSTGQATVSGIGVFPTSSLTTGVTGGTTATGTINLYKAAPPGGLVARLTKHHDRPSGRDRTSTLPVPVTVPAFVNIAEGALTASFPIQTEAVSSVSGVTLVATVNGIGGWGNLSVVPNDGPKPLSMTIVPRLLTGGKTATGTVTITRPAPDGGTVFDLSTTHPAAAQVPASVTIPAGARSASFLITTSPVRTETDVLVRVNNENGSYHWPMYVRPDNVPTLTGMTISPSTVNGGGEATGTLTFDAPIPLGTWPGLQDAMVTFTTSDPEVAGMVDEYVLAGSTTHPFRVFTRGVPQTRTVTLSTHFDGVTLSRPLTVNAVTGVTVSSLRSNVTTLSGGQGGVITVTLAAPAPAPVVLTVSTDRPDYFSDLPQTIVFSTGSTSASFAFVTSQSITTSSQVSIAATYASSSASVLLNVSRAAGTIPPLVGLTLSPAVVNAGSGSTGTVTLQGPAPAGGAVVQLFGGSPATLPASVTVPAGATTATFPISTTSVASDTSVTISGLLHLGFSTTLTVRAGAGTQPTLSGLTLSPTSVTGGNSSQGTVTLTGAAPSGGAVVMVSSSNTSAATVPASVTVPAGATSQTFTVTTQTVSSSTSSTISGTYGATRTATLTVNSAALTAPSLVSPANGATGVAQPVTLDWNNVTNATSYEVQVDNSSTIAAPFTANPTVTVSQATLSGLPSQELWWRVRARNAAGVFGPFSTMRRFTPVAASSSATLSSVSVSPSTVVGGNNVTGTATLSGTAPSGGAVVALSSSNTSVAAVPASVTIAAGASSATFATTTSSVGASTPVTISATYSGVTRTAGLTVTPPGQALTLSVTATGRSGERVTSSPTGINVAVGSTGSASFNSGTSITLTVTNGRDAIWSGACSSGSNKTRSCTFVLNASGSVTANVQ